VNSCGVLKPVRHFKSRAAAYFNIQQFRGTRQDKEMCTVIYDKYINDL